MEHIGRREVLGEYARSRRCGAKWGFAKVDRKRLDSGGFRQLFATSPWRKRRRSRETAWWQTALSRWPHRSDKECLVLYHNLSNGELFKEGSKSRKRARFEGFPKDSRCLRRSTGEGAVASCGRRGIRVSRP
nr:MAG TPA: hypothetical protein [Caudoviricetes sp.]